MTTSVLMAGSSGGVDEARAPYCLLGNGAFLKPPTIFEEEGRERERKKK